MCTDKYMKLKEKKVINLKTSTSCYEEKASVKISTMTTSLEWLLAQVWAALNLHQGRLARGETFSSVWAGLQETEGQSVLSSHGECQSLV